MIEIDLECKVVAVQTFTELKDTGDDYTGQAGKVVTVNPEETGLVFEEAASSGVETVTGYGVDNTDPINPVINSPDAFAAVATILSSSWVVGGTSGFYYDFTHNLNSEAFTYQAYNTGTGFATQDISEVIPQNSNVIRFESTSGGKNRTIIINNGGLSVSFIPTITPEYQAVLNRAITEGFALPSESDQVKGNQLIVELKTAGAFDNLTTLQVYTGSNSDFSRIDWIDTTNVYQAVNAPSYNSSTGFKFNGTSSYLTSNLFEMTTNKSVLDNYGGGFNGAEFDYDSNFRGIMGIQESSAQTYTQFVREEGGGQTSMSIGGNLTVPTLSYLQDDVNYNINSESSGPTNNLYVNSVLDQSNGLQFPAALLTPREWTVGAIRLNGNPNFFSGCSIKYMFLGTNLRGMETDINNAFTNYLS